MKKKKPTPKPRYTFVMIAFSLLLAAAGAYSLQQYYTYETTAVHDTGVVRNLERHVHRTGRRGGAIATVRPLIEFKPQGYEHAIKVHTETEERDAYDIGQQVPVEYQPNRPEQTLRIAVGIPTLDTGVGLLGVFLLLRALWKRYRWWSESRVQAA